MKRIVSIVIHILLFLVLLVGIDQAFVHLTLELPGLRQSQTFYRDFRNRLLGLGWPGFQGGLSSLPILGPETVSPSAAAPPPREQTAPVQQQPAAPRFVYPDAGGQLQFAERFEDVPPEFRDKAQPLER